MSDRTLESLWQKHGTDKYLHWYLPFYESILKDIDVKSLLEIWVLRGDSLRMRRDYFPNATIVGVDINKPIEIPWCVILKSDATTVEFANMIGNFDIIIDDGGHRVSQQRKSFENLWNHTNKLYIIEDICCSFRDKYIDEKVTMYEHIKKWCEVEWVQYKEFRKTGKPGYDPGTLVLYKPHASSS